VLFLMLYMRNRISQQPNSLGCEFRFRSTHTGDSERSNRTIMKPKESDWKKFRNSLDKWRERYLKRKNEEIRAILEDKDLSETEKFWDIVEFQKTESKILRNCLDGYSRSEMTLHIALMKKHEMICQEEIEEFSEELQEFLKNIERT
jgi:hypothetical protein